MGQNEAHCLAELEGTRWSQRGERNGADHVFQNALAAGAIGANFIPTGMELAGGGRIIPRQVAQRAGYPGRSKPTASSAA